MPVSEILFLNRGEMEMPKEPSVAQLGDMRDIHRKGLGEEGKPHWKCLLYSPQKNTLSRDPLHHKGLEVLFNI